MEKKEKEKKERGQQSAGSSQINVTNLETLQTHSVCVVLCLTPVSVFGFDTLKLSFRGERKKERK